MGKILIIDDDATFLNILSTYIKDYFPVLEVETCTNALKALVSIQGASIDLLLIDLEMPMLDGVKMFSYATESGIRNRIVILSGRDSDYLHNLFPLGTCLAVLNKYEAKQKAVLDMIFSSLQRKAVN